MNDELQTLKNDIKTALCRRREIYIKGDNINVGEQRELGELELKIRELTQKRLALEGKTMKLFMAGKIARKKEEVVVEKKKNVRGRKEDIVELIERYKTQKMEEKDIIKNVSLDTGASKTYIYKILKGTYGL